MGLLDEIEGSRVYLDTNVFIYTVEGFGRFDGEISTLFDAVDRGQGISGESEKCREQAGRFTVDTPHGTLEIRYDGNR